MKILRIGIALAVVLALSCGAAWSQQASWLSFLWDMQPISPSTAATLSGGQLWTTPSGTAKYTGMPANPAGERISAAKLIGGDGWTIPSPVPCVKARVFDPVFNTNAGWVIWVKDDTGKWFGVGRRTLDSTGWVRLWEHDGAAWYFQNLTDRGTDGNNYFTTQINLSGGTVFVKLDFVKAAGSGTVLRTGTLSYGNITEIYLWGSTGTTDYKTFKWTEFAVPEPSSLLALAGGLPILGYALRRRK